MKRNPHDRRVVLLSLRRNGSSMGSFFVSCLLFCFFFFVCFSPIIGPFVYSSRSHSHSPSSTFIIMHTFHLSHLPSFTLTTLLTQPCSSTQWGGPSVRHRQLPCVTPQKQASLHQGDSFSPSHSHHTATQPYMSLRCTVVQGSREWISV